VTAFVWLTTVYAHALILLFALLLPSTLRAENYIAAQIGVSLPGSLSSVNRVTPLDPRPDFDLMTSFLYGGKVGHYFDQLQWLGVETEVFRANPNITQNGPEPGASLSMTVWGATLLARYPGERLQPYIGVGPAIFFSRVKSVSPQSTIDEAQSTSMGLNTQLGLRLLLSDGVALFMEWKFNHSRLSFDALPNGTYDAHNLVFGIGYHF
jgi:opacity protein-like surface antigen